jgi:sporadic carbohydrate cluster protein (TIGR04323 family)
MRIPVPAQNSSLREYVTQKEGTYLLPNLESSFDNCFHQLFDAINTASAGSAIIMYSLTMLPDGAKLAKLLSECKLQGITLTFVLENFSVSENFSKILDELESYSLATLELDQTKWDTICNLYY